MNVEKEKPAVICGLSLQYHIRRRFRRGFPVCSGPLECRNPAGKAVATIFPSDPHRPGYTARSGFARPFRADGSRPFLILFTPLDRYAAGKLHLPVNKLFFRCRLGISSRGRIRRKATTKPLRPAG